LITIIMMNAMIRLASCLFSIGLLCPLAMAATGSLSRLGDAAALRTVDTDASGRFAIQFLTLGLFVDSGAVSSSI
jgi:hypothetical protein